LGAPAARPLALGVKVTVVELRDIQLPESVQRAMAPQAEAEREKRAKIIAAQGECRKAVCASPCWPESVASKASDTCCRRRGRLPCRRSTTRPVAGATTRF